MVATRHWCTAPQQRHAELQEMPTGSGGGGVWSAKWRQTSENVEWKPEVDHFYKQFDICATSLRITASHIRCLKTAKETFLSTENVRVLWSESHFSEKTRHKYDQSCRRYSHKHYEYLHHPHPHTRILWCNVQHRLPHTVPRGSTLCRSLITCSSTAAHTTTPLDHTPHMVRLAMERNLLRRPFGL